MSFDLATIPVHKLEAKRVTLTHDMRGIRLHKPTDVIEISITNDLGIKEKFLLPLGQAEDWARALLAVALNDTDMLPSNYNSLVYFGVVP